jgi:ribosomal protein S18 acetylase RimI-like enzyme
MVAITAASTRDAEAILALQKLAYQSEATLYDDWSLPPLTQTIDSLHEEFTHSIVLKATLGERIVGSVRARQNGDVCAIGRLVVHPEVQGKGIGSQLLCSIEARFVRVAKYELFTGSKSEGNIRLYRRHGYTITRTEPLSQTVSIVFMEKPGRSGLKLGS